MKKTVAIFLLAVLMITVALSAQAADNNPLTFDSAKAVAKWTLSANALGETYYDATAGVNGTGAIKLDGSVLSGVKVLKLQASVTIPMGSNVTISFSTKSNTALGEGLLGGGKRVVVRLASNDNTRTSFANNGDNTWVETSVRYVGTEAGKRDSSKNNVDKDYDTIEIVTFNLVAGDIIYIDNISITDDNGKSYLNASMLDTETTLPETTLPETTLPETTLPETTTPATQPTTQAATQAPAQSEQGGATAPDNGDAVLSLVLLGAVIVPTAIVATRKTRRVK